MNYRNVTLSVVFASSLGLAGVGCSTASKGAAVQTVAVDECPGKPAWACIAETAPCPQPEFVGKICAVGVANNMSESLGVSTASTAAKANIAKYFEARVEAFNKRIQVAHTAGDTTDEVQKVQDQVKQYSQQTLVGVMVPKRFYEPATKSTYALAVMDEVSFKKWLNEMKGMRTLSKETRERIDAAAAEVDGEVAKERIIKAEADAARSTR